MVAGEEEERDDSQKMVIVMISWAIIFLSVSRTPCLRDTLFYQHGQTSSMPLYFFLLATGGNWGLLFADNTGTSNGCRCILQAHAHNSYMYST